LFYFLIFPLSSFFAIYNSINEKCDDWQIKKKLNKIFSIDEIEEMKKNLSKNSYLPNNLYIIGHRGMGSSNVSNKFSCSLPENTIESFKEAIIANADGIEFDVFETKDQHLLIIHDDELWKNVYGIDRKGLELPKNETQQTFKVSKKNLWELSTFYVGAKGEKAPTLIEVLNLIEEANSIRAALQKKPLILNIDIKNESVAIKCFEFIDKYLKHVPDSKITFKNIYFTSSDKDVLQKLYDEKLHEGKAINIVPQISTIQIYGTDNVGDQYIIKNPQVYNKEFLQSLDNLIIKSKFVGLDCILWDINFPLLWLCKKENLQMHVYASNFKNFYEYKDFVFFIHYISRIMPLYLKTDNIKEVIFLLNNIQIDDDLINKKKTNFINKLPLPKFLINNES
jgi:glycerophosphoryl diester phosphodiesterase